MADQRQSAMLCLTLNKVKSYLAIMSLQFACAGMSIITVVSLKQGISHYILAMYSHAVATLVIAPSAVVLESTPVLDQNLYYLGMKQTSATLASATVNSLPTVTFIMAIIFRLESVNLKKLQSVAKVIGTVITVSGAMLMILYKGPIINFIGSGGGSHHGTSSEPSDQHWVTGTSMLLASVSGLSFFLILQSFTLKKYPAELSLSSLICLLVAVEGTAVSLIMERDMSVWKIGFDLRFLTAAYSGVICSGIAYYVEGVVIKERGPVFLTSFSLLCMIITAVLGAIVLAEQVRLGRFGAILVVFGLYMVVWGKSKDRKDAAESLTPEIGGTHELPNTTS